MTKLRRNIVLSPEMDSDIRKVGRQGGCTTFSECYRFIARTGLDFLSGQSNRRHITSKDLTQDEKPIQSTSSGDSHV